jgi:hypothetical protein
MPVLVTDKSAVESFNPDEVDMLYKYFFINVPPILIAEMVKNLEPSKTRKIPSISRIVSMAKKTWGLNSMINVEYRHLCYSSLIGMPIDMKGVCVSSNPQTIVQTDNGTVGSFLEETAEEMALIRWQYGQFTETEKAIAKLWRENDKLIEPDFYQKLLNALYIKLPAVKQLDALPSAVEKLINRLNLQEDLIVLLFYLLGIGSKHPSFALALRKFKESDSWYIKDYAPYAYFCLKVYFTFFIGHSNKLFRKNNEKTNIYDLEYCFYLPFTKVFTSKDAFLEDIVPLLNEPYNTFVPTEKLKEDLARLAKEWNDLDEQGRREQNFKYREHPPTNTKSIISNLWEKYEGPIHPWPAGTRMMTEEEIAEAKANPRPSEFEEFLMSIIKPVEEAYKKKTGKDRLPSRIVIGKADDEEN